MTPATAERPRPRCSFRGCPIRYTAGPDRLCRDHLEHDGLSKRAADLGVLMLAAPGEQAGEAT